MGGGRPAPRLQHPGGPPALPVAPLQPQDGGRLARTPAPTLIVRDSRLQGLHNAAQIVHTSLSRDQPVPRKSKRESLHRTQGGPVRLVRMPTRSASCVPFARTASTISSSSHGDISNRSSMSTSATTTKRDRIVACNSPSRSPVPSRCLLYTSDAA